MNFAINYSTPAAALIDGGHIQVDFFKTPPWPEMIANAERHRPVAVHFRLIAGNGQLAQQADWQLIEKILSETPTAYVNVHLNADLRDGLPFDSDNPSPAETRQVIAHMHRDVEALVKRFGAEKVIAENVPYRVGEKHSIRTSVLPEVIAEIITTHNCGLLLDIAHARIAADSLGMDAKAYMRALPLERLRELHFTGLHDLGGHLMDHLPVLDADWPWLEWVFEGIQNKGWGKPHLLAFEYGGENHPFFDANSDPQVILRDVPRMVGMCKGIE